MLPHEFAAMEESLHAAEQTGRHGHNAGISVALWRLRGLVLGYRWALDHGFVDPLVDPEDKPCLTCQPTT